MVQRMFIWQVRQKVLYTRINTIILKVEEAQTSREKTYVEVLPQGLSLPYLCTESTVQHS